MSLGHATVSAQTSATSCARSRSMNAWVRKLSCRISKACRSWRSASVWVQARPSTARIVAAGEPRRRFRVVRQQRKKRRDPLLIEAEIGRKLPEDRPELRAKPEQAGREEVRERRLGLPEPLDMRDEARPLDREDEAGRRLLRPAREVSGR